MWSIFLLAIKGTSRVIFVCGAGVYLQRAGILSQDVRKAISQTVVQLLLPCLLFTRILRTMDLGQLRVLLWLGLGNITYVTLGAAIGLLTTLVSRPPRAIRNILAVSPAIGHANSIPLMLAPHICALHGERFQAGDALVAEGYIGLYLIMHTFTLWGVGLNVIQRPKEPLATPPEPAPATVGSETAGAAGADSTLPPAQMSLDDELSSRETWSEAVSQMETGAPPPPAQQKRRISCHPHRWRDFIPQWLNRPMFACLLAVAVGLVPPLRKQLVDIDGVANVPFAAMEQLAAAGPVVALLGVGAAFVADGVPGIGIVGYRPLMGLIVGRLVVLPALALPLWVCLRRLQVPFFPVDPVFMLVLGLEACMPSAFNIVTMCTLQGIGEREMSGALFYQSLAAVPTVTIWTAVILRFVVT